MLRLGFLVFAVLLAVVFYHFVGPAPGPSEIFDDLEWWRPRGWLHRWEAFAALADLAESRGAERLVPLLLLWLPPLALALAAVALFRSALVRAAVCWLALTLGFLAYYGLLADSVWSFLEWRLPAVAASVAAVVAVVALAPSLLRALWKVPALAALVVLAVCAVVFLLSTEITGTDESLPFNLSPWPAVTVFGFLLAGYAVAALHLAAGAGLWIWERAGGASGALAGCAAAAGVASAAGALLMSDPAPLALAVAAGLGAGYAVAAGALAGGASASRRSSALSRLAAGALVALTIYGSSQAAQRFQVVARNETAQRVLVALEAYKAEHGMYPDRLADLAPEFLDAVPQPRIGLIRHEDDAFRYSNFGDSYALEFASVEWVQCAYSPPYEFAEYDEEDDWDRDEAPADGEELDAWERYDVGAAAAPEEPEDEALHRSLREAGLEGSWNCAEKPPKIW